MRERDSAPRERPTESPSRRRFFAALAAGSSAVIAAALGGPLAALALAPLRRTKDPSRAARVDLGPLAQFTPTGAGSGGPQEVVFPVTLEDGYMTRRAKQRVYVVPDPHGPSGLAVLDTTCSHLGCGVSWNADRKAFLCPCHGGMYSEGGEVIGGPPPRPLTRLPFRVTDGRVSLDLA